MHVAILRGGIRSVLTAFFVMTIAVSAQADPREDANLNLNNSDWKAFLKEEREALSDFPAEIQEWSVNAREYIQNTSFSEAKNDFFSLLASDELAGFLSTQPPQIAALGEFGQEIALTLRSLSTGNNLRILADEAGLLRMALREKGNFGLGSANAETADRLGKAWVGDSYTVASDGRTLVSEDGLRQYRPPTQKQKSGLTQANFQWRPEKFDPTRPGKPYPWIGNGHLLINNGN